MGDVLRREPHPLEDLGARAVVEEFVGQAQFGHGGVDAGLTEILPDASAHAADPHAVLQGDDEPIVRGEPHDALGHGNDPARIDHRRADAVRLEPLRHVEADARHGADGHDEHVAALGLDEHVDAIGRAADRVVLGADGALREAQHGGRVLDAHRLAELLGQAHRIARSGDPDAGDDLQDRQIPDAVVTRPVGPGDSGAIEHEGDAGLVQGDVHQQLVERAVHEGGVDGDDGMEPAEGEPGRARDRVLLGDADVEDAGREALRHAVQAGGPQHGRGDAHEPFVVLGELHELVGEDARPALRAARVERFARLRVDLPDGVELVGHVVAGGLVAAALLGDRVDDDRGAVVLRLPEGVLHRVLVMPVDGADVLDVEVRVERLVVGEAGEEPVQAAAHAAVERLRRSAEPLEGLAAGQVQIAVGALRAHGVQEAGHAADGRGVGAAVVVHDDDELAGVVVGDVVERLPRHAARERPVADDGHDMAVVLPGHLERLRDSVGPRERAGGVRGLDDVVLGLAALRVAREAAVLAQGREVLTAGQQLVHVRLVAGVEDDGVLRRGEHPVYRDRELDHAEVRAQVPARLRDVRDEVLAHLLRELVQLLPRETVEVTRASDRLQQGHLRRLSVRREVGVRHPSILRDPNG
ncbi:hypothetical protein GCM10009857_27470 [Agromyces soli]